MKAIAILSGIGFVLLYGIVSLIAGAFAAVGLLISCCAWPFAVASRGVLRIRDGLA